MVDPTEELNVYLAALAGSGATLPDGLRAAAAEAGSRRTRRRLVELASRIENGESMLEILSGPDAELGGFTSTAILSGLSLIHI